MNVLLAVLSLILAQSPASQNTLSPQASREQPPLAPSALVTSSRVSQLTQKDVLSIHGGRFFLEGEPFAEISFNKFDLFWQLYDQLAAGKPLNESNPMLQAQDKALADLHALGFKTVRIFALPWGPAGPAVYANPETRKTLYAALDKTLDLCDRHGIRVVWSLGAGAFTDTRLDAVKGWSFGEEQVRELMRDRESRGRKLLYQYLDETLTRYRQRKAVLMWEISNELTLLADIGDSNRVYNGERMPSLKDVALFFDEVARRIKTIDPLRLVSSGGSNMRESQWHLYLGEGWKTDTLAEQFKCFEMLYATSAVDVIDMHSYPDNMPGYAILNVNGEKTWLNDQGYMSLAKRLGKPLMIGELGLHAIPKSNKNVWGATPDYFESYNDTAAAKPWVIKTLDQIVEAGVPLTYWWCYQSDRTGDQKDPQRFDIDLARNPELVTCIVEANRRLKVKLHAKP